jgi:putative nucleotidyltransferase with HDIG domain
MSTVLASDIVQRLRDLPPLPAIVADLMNHLGDEDTGARLLADKIAQDQALTAKTLRLANSSFYGMQRKVGTIQQAVAIVGLNSIQTLITAIVIIDRFSGCNGAFDLRAFWRHSIGTALCARTCATLSRINPDQAFIAGLLHDIGRLALASQVPDAYDRIAANRAERDCLVLDAERAILDIDHMRIGRALAEHWKFPLPIQQAIEHHHTPDRPGAGPLTALVHVADAIAHALDLSGDESDAVPPIAASAWNSVRLGKEGFWHVFRDTEAQTEEACRILVAA